MFYFFTFPYNFIYLFHCNIFIVVKCIQHKTCYFLIGGKLLYNVVLASANQPRLYIYALSLELPPISPSCLSRSSRSTSLGSLCYIATFHMRSKRKGRLGVVTALTKSWSDTVPRAKHLCLNYLLETLASNFKIEEEEELILNLAKNPIWKKQHF